MNFPEKLQKKLQKRIHNNSLRSLGENRNLIDFSSNDYLGFSKSEEIFKKAHQFLVTNKSIQNGATGSRLLSGNYDLYSLVEKELSVFHNIEGALLFNSGYNANLGVFSSVPQRGDYILYDELIHASIRDGIQLSNAKQYKFSHNDIKHLEDRIISIKKEFKNNDSAIYVVTESVFSMDGDIPDLKKMVEICESHQVFFIVDEAHSVGVFGMNGRGLIQELGLENKIFARIITFGKALGSHGAVVLGSQKLKEYLVNFSRSFIYTTGLPPHAIATIKQVYQLLESINGVKSIQQLHENIHHFQTEIERLQLNFIKSKSAIHCCVVSGNEQTKRIAKRMQDNGFDVKPILSPTVAEGQERLRFCLHSYNTKKEITQVLENLSTFVM